MGEYVLDFRFQELGFRGQCNIFGGRKFPQPLPDVTLSSSPDGDLVSVLRVDVSEMALLSFIFLLFTGSNSVL